MSSSDASSVRTERLEILDALIMAVDNRSKLFDIIEAAPAADAARQAVMQAFGFTEAQTVHVLDLQARRFAKSERVRLEQKRADLMSGA